MFTSEGNKCKRRASIAARHKAREIKLLLDSSAEQIPTISAIEDKFNLSRQYLQLGFYELYGITIGNYGKTLKLRLIKELLKDYSLTLDTIAITTGYNGGEALNRFFKTMEGISPGQWRRQFQDSHK